MPPEPRPINLKKTPSLTILLAIAMVNVCGCLCYGPGQMLRAREAVLKEDLYTLRNSIDQSPTTNSARRNPSTSWSAQDISELFPPTRLPVTLIGKSCSKVRRQANT
jgi:hypothetical protein